MKTYAGDAESIVNRLPGIDYESQYSPLMDAIEQLAEYEATNKTPEEIRAMTALLRQQGIHGVEVISEGDSV